MSQNVTKIKILLHILAVNLVHYAKSPFKWLKSFFSIHFTFFLLYDPFNSKWEVKFKIVSNNKKLNFLCWLNSN